MMDAIGLKVHDHRGQELVCQDLLGFTLSRLENHLQKHGWSLTHRDMEVSQWMMADGCSGILTVTIERKVEANG
jgi:hypothetical protein